MNYQPRNDYVLIRLTYHDFNPAGIAVSQQSLEGKQYHVEAIGPKVEGLKVGDRILMVGSGGEDWAFLPNSKDLLLLKEANVVLIYKE